MAVADGRARAKFHEIGLAGRASGPAATRVHLGNSEAISYGRDRLVQTEHIDGVASKTFLPDLTSGGSLGTELDFAAGHARVLALARAALNIDRSDS